MLAEGDTLHTVVKFLRHERSKEKEEAVALLYELSKSEALCENIGSVNGAILILVGMSSSKSENISTIENADKTLENLEKSENNIRQMAQYGRLRPLLTQILQGAYMIFSIRFISSFHLVFSSFKKSEEADIFFYYCLYTEGSIHLKKYFSVFFVQYFHKCLMKNSCINTSQTLSCSILAVLSYI